MIREPLTWRYGLLAGMGLYLGDLWNVFDVLRLGLSAYITIHDNAVNDHPEAATGALQSRLADNFGVLSQLPRLPKNLW